MCVYRVYACVWVYSCVKVHVCKFVCTLNARMLFNHPDVMAHTSSATDVLSVHSSPYDNERNILWCVKSDQ